MTYYNCESCGYSMAVGVEISFGQSKVCTCGSVMKEYETYGAKVYLNEGTNARIDNMAKFKVGGDLINKGEVGIKGRGEMEVAKNVLNTGKIQIDDPVTYKEIVLEAIRSGGSVAEFGTEILKKLKFIQ